MYSFLKTTLIGGVLFLAPVVVLIAIVEKGLGYARKAVVPVADALFKGTFAHAFVGDLLAFGLLLVLCFLAGLAAKTSLPASMLTCWSKEYSPRFPSMTAQKARSWPRCRKVPRCRKARRPRAKTRLPNNQTLRVEFLGIGQQPFNLAAPA